MGPVSEFWGLWDNQGRLEWTVVFFIKNTKSLGKIVYLCIRNYDYIDLVHLYLLMK